MIEMPVFYILQLGRFCFLSFLPSPGDRVFWQHVLIDIVFFFQGGSAFSPASIISKRRAQTQAAVLADDVGCPSSTSEEIVACLRQLPARVLNDAQTKVHHCKMYVVDEGSKEVSFDMQMCGSSKNKVGWISVKKELDYGGVMLMSVTSTSDLWILTAWFSARLKSFYTTFITTSKIKINFIFLLLYVPYCLPLGVFLEGNQVPVASVTSVLQKENGEGYQCTVS